MAPPPRIRRLPRHVVAHIAAGEVVDRPASVVKELLENSIDAGARKIEVVLGGGGNLDVAVIDDGHGIEADQLALAVTAHATSKLVAAADLESIGSLGFRGEALAAMAQVASLTITSRPRDQVNAASYHLAGGEGAALRSVGAPAGTEVRVRDLFFNTPARRSFMRAPATELAYVLQVVRQVVLAREGISAWVCQGGRRLLDIPGDVDAAGRVAAAIGGRRACPFAARDGDTAVAGVVVEAGRGAGRGLFLFVNGRFVRDRALQRVVGDALAAPGGDHHACFAWVQMACGDVDVNVHPQKLEVRFRRPRQLWALLLAAVAQARPAQAMARPPAPSPEVEPAGAEVARGRAGDGEGSVPGGHSAWAAGGEPGMHGGLAAGAAECLGSDSGYGVAGHHPACGSALAALDAAPRRAQGASGHQTPPVPAPWLALEGPWAVARDASGGWCLVDWHQAARALLARRWQAACAERAAPTVRLLLPERLPRELDAATTRAAARVGAEMVPLPGRATLVLGVPAVLAEEGAWLPVVTAWLAEPSWAAPALLRAVAAWQPAATPARVATAVAAWRDGLLPVQAAVALNHERLARLMAEAAATAPAAPPGAPAQSRRSISPLEV